MSNIALRGEVVTPDGYYSPGEPTGPIQAWEALNPCPACGATPHGSPHGVNASGDPHWQFEHCWKCGYRPGVNNAVSQDELTRQFQAFQQFISKQTADDAAHKTLNAPAADEVAALRAQMEQMQADLARYREGADGGVPNPSTQPPISGGNS